jgi:hypothetical protein
MMKSVYRGIGIMLTVGCAQGSLGQDMFMTQMQGISNWQLSSNMATVNSIVNEENFGGNQRSGPPKRDATTRQLQVVATNTKSH